MHQRHSILRRGVSVCLTALLAVATPLSALAQQPDTGPATFDAIHVTAGRSRVLTTDFDVLRIAVTNPAIADAVVVQPREVLIDSKAPGTISLILWGANRRAQYDLV